MLLISFMLMVAQPDCRRESVNTESQINGIALTQNDVEEMLQVGRDSKKQNVNMLPANVLCMSIADTVNQLNRDQKARKLLTQAHLSPHKWTVGVLALWKSRDDTLNKRSIRSILDRKHRSLYASNKAALDQLLYLR